MSEHHKLSLTAAILININIMIGSGVFINTAILGQRAGALGALSYAIIGILMFPLILSVSQLLKLHPAGGFYIFGRKEINPFAGFLATWSYFVGKLASATLVLHVSVLFMQQLIPLLAIINPFLLDLILLTTFIALNMNNIKTGSQIQGIFMGLKMIPVLFLILGGLFVFNGDNLTSIHRIWSGIPSTIPLVLFAMLGFEAACSLSSKIKNAQKNAALSVLISYGIVIFLYCTYQLIFYAVLGSEFLQIADYRYAFPAFLAKLFPGNIGIQKTLTAILNLAIASSALSSSYSIIFSNAWNLYALAQHKHIFIPHIFSQFNKNHIPWLCVIAEGIICILYLFVTKADQITLQQTGALGCVIGYTISVIALINAKRNKHDTITPWIIPLLAFGNCIILIDSCTKNLLQSGISTISFFGLLLLLGISMFWYNERKVNVT